LAKLTGGCDGSQSQTDVPTRRVDTDPGTVMGTVGYISPEQLRGRPADNRSDIFSFGAIFYEMLSGRRAFRGESAADTISSILREDPPELSATNSSIAPALERIVHHCLEKNPEERFHSARDLAFALENISGTSGQALASTAFPSRQPRNRERVIWIGLTAALLLTTVLALLLPFFRRAQRETHAVRFNIALPEKAAFFTDVETHNLSVSPDGSRLAFVATDEQKRMLWVRSLNELSAQALSGTEGAYSPFWSPDSRHIAFFAEGKLKRIEASGASLQTLCALSVEVDTVGTWGRDGTILFNDQFTDPVTSNISPEKSLMRIYRVPATGGTPTLLMKPEKVHMFWVQFLPDSRHFLFYGYSEQPDANGIYVGSIDSSDIKLLVRTIQTRMEYASPGYLLYAREGSLLAHPFDLQNLRLTGEPFTLVERLPYFDKTGWAEFSVSENGVLAYATNVWTTRLIWFDRGGREVGQVGTTDQYWDFRVSPDGLRVALAVSDARTGSADIWIHDFARDTRTRFAFGPTDDADAVWSPDGQRLAFFSCCEGQSTLYIKELNDTGKGQSPVPPRFGAPADWSGDGRFIAYAENAPTTNHDLWILPLFGEQKPYAFLQTQFNEIHAQFSPNGRFVAYVSNESGNDEVYVARFDNPREKWRISTTGGTRPRWRRDGKELFYLAADNSLMAMPIKGDDSLEAAAPLTLFKTNTIVEKAYDVSADGQRFLVNSGVIGTQSLPFVVMLNWTVDLKRQR
jgi:eukaryotic-like serine/threonine-protein kinase